MPFPVLSKLGKVVKFLVPGAVGRVGVGLKVKLEEKTEITGKLLGSK